MPRKSSTTPNLPTTLKAPKSSTVVKPELSKPRATATSIKSGGRNTAAQSDRKTEVQPTEPKQLGAASDPPTTPPQRGKLVQVISLTERDGGASLNDLMAATGWQAHSVRVALSTLKKRLGRPLESILQADGQRCYELGKT